ncbi:uncharacterized protein LOC142616847 [Castanea sativa]|uniref:uncharacterized protein LOC142616847 n=1 Tax=Castanea sativa TaxID=21020 RepID=UPI003F65008B
MCRAFLTTLKGTVRVRFNKISPGTIANFEQLSESFVRHVIGGQRHKKPMGHLLNIRQVKGESMRQYVDRFNKEVLQVYVVEDQITLTTFQAGLFPGDFYFSITKTPPKTMTKLLHKPHKYMNVEVQRNCWQKKETRQTHRSPSRRRTKIQRFNSIDLVCSLP